MSLPLLQSVLEATPGDLDMDYIDQTREQRVEQEFTPADGSQYSGVAERRIAMVWATSMAARIDADRLSGTNVPGSPTPSTDLQQ